MNNKKDSDREIRVGCCQLCSIIIELGHNKARTSISRIEISISNTPLNNRLKKSEMG